MYTLSLKARKYIRRDRRPPLPKPPPKYQPHIPVLDRLVAQPGGCWIWAGTQNANGYGVFQLDGTTWLAHRFFYAYFLGPIPPSSEITHTCSARLCVNPTHLCPTDHQAALRRGRNAKLNPAQVQEIRTLHATGTHTLAALARRFGVSRTNIHAIVTGKSWRPPSK